MTAHEWLCDIAKVCSLQTKEGALTGHASKSELRRWLVNKALQVDGARLGPDDAMPSDPASIVLFPSNERKRITLW